MALVSFSRDLQLTLGQFKAAQEVGWNEDCTSKSEFPIKNGGLGGSEKSYCTKGKSSSSLWTCSWVRDTGARN